jgi:hypothetical protein
LTRKKDLWGKDNRFAQTFTCLFGAISMEGKQLFRQYDKFNGDTFLNFLKIIHSRFPKMLHFHGQKSISPHYRSRKVTDYIEQNKNTIITAYILIAHHHRIYDTGGRGMKYSQARFTCTEILSIICRF